jgi:hypothetical protein
MLVHRIENMRPFWNKRVWQSEFIIIYEMLYGSCEVTWKSQAVSQHAAFAFVTSSRYT